MRLASVRRSLFTNDAARSKFLAHLMTGTKEILQTGQGVVGLSHSLSCHFLSYYNDIEQRLIYVNMCMSTCMCVRGWVHFTYNIFDYCLFKHT